MIIITIVIIVALIVTYMIYQSYNVGKVWDFAHIYSSIPAQIVIPRSIDELRNIINNNYKLKDPYKICIAGGKYSHGGHTMADDALYIDMKKLNKISLSDDKNSVNVEAGATWEIVQKYLDRYNLSVAEMQSYRNFSVGGSISVNCHGRGMKYGTIADTVQSMVLLTTDGNVIHASRKHNLDIFRGVIGGYGSIAIILSAELIVEENFPIERVTQIAKYQDIHKILSKLEGHNDNLIFYNGNIYPKKEDEIVNIYWYRTDKGITDNTRLRPNVKINLKTMVGEQLLRRTHSAKYIRAHFEPKKLAKNETVWKNYEMGYDTNSLKQPAKYPTTAILQEYFIPTDKVIIFLKYFWKIMSEYNVNLLNLSLRYVKKTDIPILNYAPSNRIAVVLYLNIHNNYSAIEYAKIWTRLLINKSIHLYGSYYLPYLPLATVKQFRIVYPNYEKLIQIKNKYDKKNLLTSHFIKKYILQ